MTAQQHVSAMRRGELSTSASAYVLAIATTLPHLAIDLYSTYTGHEHTGTIAAHLILARDAYQAIAQEHEHNQLPLSHERRHCLEEGEF